MPIVCFAIVRYAGAVPTPAAVTLPAITDDVLTVDEDLLVFSLK